MAVRKRVEVFRARNGKWYFRLRDRQGVHRSPKDYSRKDSAIRGAKRAYPALAVEVVPR